MKTFILLLLLAAMPNARAADQDVKTDSKSDTKAEQKDEVKKDELKTEETYNKALDGVLIEAVENYPNPKRNELGLQLGLLPFKSYYNGFALTGDYIYYFNKTIAWEVINASYAFTVGTNLTTQLADKYGVAPNQIEQVQFLVSTNIMYVFTHGKTVFLDDLIRYFRASVIGGVGLANTNLQSEFGLNVGLRIDAYINDNFSLKLEFRDMITLTSGIDSFGVFSLGTGINF
jgi:outer membrane beta-barrel protein